MSASANGDRHQPKAPKKGVAAEADSDATTTAAKKAQAVERNELAALSIHILST
jgi:hypothetical protein